MHDPVYPIQNDHLVFYKNWMTDQFTLTAFSSNWPFRAIANQENIDEPLSEPWTAYVVCKSGDKMSLLNESFTFDLAYQRCEENNLTFC